MKLVDLGQIAQFKNDPQRDRREAINWLYETYGPAGDRWTLKDLTYVEFRKDRDADLFVLRWS